MEEVVIEKSDVGIYLNKYPTELDGVVDCDEYRSIVYHLNERVKRIAVIKGISMTLAMAIGVVAGLSFKNHLYVSGLILGVTAIAFIGFCLNMTIKPQLQKFNNEFNSRGVSFRQVTYTERINDDESTSYTLLKIFYKKRQSPIGQQQQQQQSHSTFIFSEHPQGVGQPYSSPPLLPGVQTQQNEYIEIDV
ncbi:hypothetical protein CYY_009443 [Polysphondylium violaceum]|uniref:Transmembrane protein n=1 Tax=Polysphondylium violaceum TaxID=133409 RepID=A0A8J4PLE5_9MYCE|nr:hypothetical protein CYY_009443 [Polysphondylium violaceum]